MPRSPGLALAPGVPAAWIGRFDRIRAHYPSMYEMIGRSSVLKRILCYWVFGRITERGICKVTSYRKSEQDVAEILAFSIQMRPRPSTIHPIGTMSLLTFVIGGLELTVVALERNGTPGGNGGKLPIWRHGDIHKPPRCCGAPYLESGC